jgi:hypothetical protein
MFLLCESSYVCCMMTLKISLALFFLRLLHDTWQHRAIYAIGAIYIALSLAYFFFVIFQCGIPGPNFWIKQFAGQCVSSLSWDGFSLTHSIVSATTDIALVSISHCLKASLIFLLGLVDYSCCTKSQDYSSRKTSGNCNLAVCCCVSEPSWYPISLYLIQTGAVLLLLCVFLM